MHIAKINRRTIDDAEDLDLVMSMYNQYIIQIILK